MRNVVQLYLAAIIFCSCAFLLLANRSCVKMAAPQRYSLKNKFGDRIIKELLNWVIAKDRDLSVCRRDDLFATDKSRYFAQLRPIIVH